MRTNDINIAAGEAASTETNPVLMVLASTLTKQLDAAWAVGTNAGGRDTGSIADGTWHVWMIGRSDTGVIDGLFSLSDTAPTMPSVEYDWKRRIGAVERAGGTILGFKQIGNRFYYNTVIFDINSTTLGNARSLFALSVPPNQIAMMRASALNATAGVLVVVQPTFETNAVPANAAVPGATSANPTAAIYGRTYIEVPVDASSQVAARASAASTILRCMTKGWIDSLI